MVGVRADGVDGGEPDRRSDLWRFRARGLGMLGWSVAAFALAWGLLAMTGYPDNGPVSGIAVLLIGGSLPFALFALLSLLYSLRLAHTMRSNPGGAASGAVTAADGTFGDRLDMVAQDRGQDLAAGAESGRRTPDLSATPAEPDGSPVRGSLVFTACGFGVAAALPAAALVAGIGAATQFTGGLFSLILGIAAGYGVQVGAGPLSPRAKRGIAMAATAVGLAAWEYVAARQDLALTRAPLGLSWNGIVTILGDDLGSDPWVLLVWAFALFIAGNIAGQHSQEEAPTARRVRLPGSPYVRWAIAAVSAAVGVIALAILARTSLSANTEDPFAAMRVGNCVNVSDTSDSRVACGRPHDDEVYYRFQMPAGHFRGDKATGDAADATCETHLDGYVGTSTAHDTYFDYSIPPDRDHWVVGDRIAVCLLSRGDRQKITGTARGQ